MTPILRMNAVEPALMGPKKAGAQIERLQVPHQRWLNQC
jgi:hypothetical protein